MGCEREPLFPRTRQVLDAQGAGSLQATRKRRLAMDAVGLWMQVSLPAWLEFLSLF